MLKKISLFASVIFIACVFSTQAFNFAPITQDYTPSGKGSSQVFRVSNPGNEKVAVKISIKPRSIEPDGTEIQGEPTSSFLIYPKQMILEPGTSRSIRIKWTGDQNPESEIPFRIIAEQVPVSFSETQPIEGGQITLTLRYEGTVYIVPPGAKPKLSIKNILRATDSEIEYLSFEIENSGTRHTILEDIELKFKRDENDPQPIILEDDDLKGVAGENMLAGSVRIFRIPMPEGMWEGPIYGSIKQTPVK